MFFFVFLPTISSQPPISYTFTCLYFLHSLQIHTNSSHIIVNCIQLSFFWSSSFFFPFNVHFLNYFYCFCFPLASTLCPNHISLFSFVLSTIDTTYHTFVLYSFFFTILIHLSIPFLQHSYSILFCQLPNASNHIA